MRQNLLKALLVSLLAGSIFFFCALNIFLGNPLEMNALLSQILPKCVQYALVLAGLIFLCQLPALFFKRFFPLANLFFLTAAMFVWAQGNLFIWPIKTPPGGVPFFSDSPLFGVLEIILFTIASALILCFRTFFIKNTAKICLVLIGAQLIAFLPGYMKYDEKNLGNKFYTFTDEGSNTFSTDQNVIILIMDSFSEDYFNEARKKCPGEFEKTFQDFTNFRRLLSPAPFTAAAVPTLVSGTRELENDTFKNWRYFYSTEHQNHLNRIFDHNNLFERFSANKYEIFAKPLVKMLIPYTQGIQNREKSNNDSEFYENICLVLKGRFTPLVLRQTIYENSIVELYSKIFSSPKPSGANEVVQSIPLEKMVFISQNLDAGKYYIRDEAAVKLILPDSLRQYGKTDQKKLLFYHFQSVHWAQGAKDSKYHICYINQSVKDLRMLGNFLQNLRTNRVYDNSYIVILGDHGTLPELSSPTNCYNPFLLIKKPNQKGETLSFNDEIVLMRDLCPTILFDHGISFKDGTAPYSIYSLSAEQKQERQGYWERLMGTKP